MLNEAQTQAVKIVKGPLRIIAGVGTGKTHTLTQRIKYLVDGGISTHEILTLTFTNKAAHEIKKRLNYPAGVMTFHALAASLLRKFWRNDFTINDPDDPDTLDFDGLLTRLLELFENLEVFKKCQRLYSHILVDEYQDVNREQIKILQKLAAHHRNLCVVGDPDQTIYSWRGAAATSMQQFSDFFKDARTITLTENYRNPPRILNSAETLIKNNQNRLEKTLKAIKTDRTITKVWHCKDSPEESEILIHLLEQTIGSHSAMTDADNLDTGHDGHVYSFGDIAVIYRTQAQGRQIAGLLRRRGYPCQLSKTEEFFGRSEIKQFLQELSALRNLSEFPDQKFSDWMSDRLKNFLEIQKFSKEKQKRLELLLPLSLSFNSEQIRIALTQFLDEINTAKEADNLVNPGAIQLLTFHAAKGLQFPIVIIPGLEEGVTPHKKSLDDKHRIEEERRLLYVGMTRAGEALHLLTNQKSGPPSRFLAEIKHADRQSLPGERLLKLQKRKLKSAQQKLF